MPRQKTIQRPFSLLFLILFGVLSIKAQKPANVLKDTLDNKLDVSYFLTHLHGFIPVLAVISEPALGNFGLVLAPVFIAPQKSKNNKDRFHFPSITALMGMYTLNKSWMAGAFHMGSAPKLGLRYRLGGAFGSINMDFYREVPLAGEQKFAFNFDLKAFMLEGSKDIFRNRIFLGTSYIYANSNIAYTNLFLPQGVFEEEDFESAVGNLGFFVDADFRNSIFTADKGFRIKPTYMINRSWTGSDYTFDRAELLAHLFLQPTKRWVSAFRAEGMAISDGAPFYAQPFVFMRGIPMLRYQGKQTLVFETEQRFDITRRWSVLGFVGSGKAFNQSEFSNEAETWHWSGGAGFRYLMSRLFNLRVGVDVAKGPENYAYYIVFGHSWNR
jgi:hypothetical protein